MKPLLPLLIFLTFCVPASAADEPLTTTEPLPTHVVPRRKTSPVSPHLARFIAARADLSLATVHTVKSYLIVRARMPNGMLAIWYVRFDGSTTTNCTGQTNSAYDGSGTGEPCAYSNLQDAIDAAALGDDIIVRAGDTFTGTFWLPNKGAGTDYIIIKSSALASLPVNKRVFPADVASMFTLTGDGSGSGGGSNQPVLATYASSHHWKIQGAHITPTVGNTVKSIVQLESHTGQGTGNTSTIPHHIVIDRCYIHSAGSSDTSVVRGIALNSTDSEVVDSYVSDIHGTSTDAQAIFAWNTPGNLIITNNYLEATSECLQLGYTTGENIAPDNVVITKNHISRPLAWMGPGGSGGLANYGNVKNLFEMKGGTNVTFSGNVLENNWADGQGGMAFAIKNYINEMHHVTISNNLIRQVGAVLSIGSSPEDPLYLGPWAHDIIFSNNLVYGLDSATYDNPFNGNDADGYFVLTGHIEDATYDHNTVVEGGHVTLSGNDFVIAPGASFTNNVAGTVGNKDIISTIFNNAGTMSNNVRPDSYGGGHDGTEDVFGYNDYDGVPVSFPQVTLYPSLNGSVYWFVLNASEVGFVSTGNANYALDAASNYKGEGAGGTDPGVNLTTLSAAIGASSNNYATATFKAITGDWTGAAGGTATVILGKVTLSGRVTIQ